MSNIRLKIAYEGTHYLGWQKTEMGPSIEGTLQQALKRILRQDVILQAASRTDAGVHARGQVVNFVIENNTLNLIKLMYGLNSLLPKDITILEISEAPAGFHPTLDCIGKEYHYLVCCGAAQMPHRRFYSWHFPRSLDRGAMRRAARELSGEHDFSAFCNFKKNRTYSHHVRWVDDIEIIEPEEKQLLFIIRGNNFLYKMVRNLVGTLLYVGCGKISEESMPVILALKDRKHAGITAPSHGLYLHAVKYDLTYSPFHITS